MTNNLAAWFDASSLTLSNVTAVTNWVDISGTGHDATQAVAAAEPIFLTNVINGHPVVRFDGVDDALLYDGSFLATSDYTVFVVEGRRSAKANSYFMGGSTASANNNLHIGYRTDNTLTHAQYGNDINVTVPTFTNQQFRLYSFHLNATGGTGREIYRDGTRIGTSASTAQLGSYNGARLGGYGATGNRYEGDLAEVLIYNRYLNPAERNAVGAYLADKYAIPTVYVDPAGADVAISIALQSQSVLSVGDTVEYTVTVFNNGFTNATAVTVTNALPAGLDLVSASSADYSGTNGEWTITNLDYLGATTLTVRATANTSAMGAAVTIAAGRQSGGETDYRPANDAAALTVNVRDQLTPTDFTCRMRIDFPGYDRTDTLTNFPALIRLSEAIPGFRYGLFASTQGNDLRFAGADGITQLHYDTDAWNPDGTSPVWVQVDALAAGGYIWAYWGNPALAATPPSTQDTALTWGDRYAGVWHFNENTVGAPAADAGPGGNDGVPTDQPGVVSTGVISGARRMTGIECFTAGDGVNLSNKAFTLSAWVYRYENTTGDNMWFGGGVGAADRGLHCGFRNANIHFGLYSDDGTCTNDYNADRGAWHYYTHVLDENHVKQLYRDGVPVPTSGATNGFYKSVGLTIGGTYNQVPQFKGLLDEARAAAGVARSADWVWASWATVASNATFTTYNAASGPPIVDNLAPTGVIDTAAVLNGELSFTGAVPTTVYVFWGETDGGAAWGAWANTNALGTYAAGTISTPVSGLSVAADYAYTYYASNSYGTTWATPSATFRTRTPSYWTITPSADANGAIVPGVPETVDNGDDSSVYTFTPDTGYHLTNVLVDAAPIGVTNAYQFINVVANHTIEALFGLNQYTVTVVQAANGTITPPTGAVVQHGGDAQLGIQPDNGYYVSDVLADGISLGALHGITLTNVTAPRTVTAVFDALPHGMVTNGLVLWLNGGTVNQSNGTYVTEWRDYSGRGNNATQPMTWLGPRFHDDRFGPHCYFDGAASYMRVANEQDFDFTTEMTILCVARHTDADTWRAFVAKDGEPNGWQFREFTNVNRLSLTTRGLTGADPDGPRGMVGDIQNEAVLAGRMNGLFKEIWYNGVSDGTLTYTGGAISTNDVAVTLGARDSGGIGAYAQCDIYEMLIFNRALTDRELNSAGFYLAAKYGLPGDYTDPQTPTPIATGSHRRWTTGATLDGTLASTGAAPATVWACWDTTDKGTTNLLDWAGVVELGEQTQGAITANATGLNPDSDYVYRFAASNAYGVAWSDATAFESGADPNNYSQALRVQFNGYAGTTALTNFPALVRLSPATEGFSYTNFASTLGGDLRFMDATRTYTLNHEIDRWATVLNGADVGAVGAVGSHDYPGAEITVTGSGADIWGTADEFHYAFMPLSGDGAVTARITGYNNPGNEWCKAGVMFRESLDANTRYAFMMSRPDSQTDFQWRTNVAVNAQSVGINGVTALPIWVRIVRSGNQFSGYASADGESWVLRGQQTIAIATNALIGLAVASHNDGTLSTVTFDNVRFDVPDESVAWVQVPVLAGSDDYVWALWGNPNRPTAPLYTTDHSVWPEDYAAVWHMTEVNTLDATANGNNGIGTLNAQVNGLIAGAQSFTNAGNIAFNGRIDLRNRSFSVEAWSLRSATANDDFICGQGAEGDMLHIGFRANNQFAFAFWGDDLNINGPWDDTTAWHHWTCVYDSTTRRQEVFRDGVPLDSRTAGEDLTEFGTFYVGARGDGSYNFQGAIDEVRVAYATLSPDWVTSSYSNQVANSTFITFSTMPPEKPGTLLMVR